MVPNSCVIIGLGNIGMEYDYGLAAECAIYTHARAIDVHPAFNLVGAVDVSRAQCSRFEQTFGKPAFYQVESAMQALNPELVVISTPAESHSSVLSRVLDTCQPKLVICEKPLSYELHEAREVVEMCERSDIHLFVNYIRRTDPGVIEIKSRIDSGEIKGPVKANAWYSKGIYNNGSHFLNLLEFWLGNTKGVKLINAGRLWDDHDPEPDVEVEFDKGTAVFRAVWEEAYSYYSIELLSQSGRLRYENGGEYIQWQGVCSDPHLEEHRILEKQVEIIPSALGVYQWHVYDQISKHLNHEATTLCTGREALKTLETIDLITRQTQLCTQKSWPYSVAPRR